MQLVTAGIDVSAKELVVATRKDSVLFPLQRFSNDSKGHTQLIRWLTRTGRCARVVLESTGVYGLELALALHATDGVDVMVANPRAIKDFGDALFKRTKTDPEDAIVILEFAERMPFQLWRPPSTEALELRALARRIKALKGELVAESNRLHAAEFGGDSRGVIANDIRVNVRHLQRRLAILSKEAMTLVRADALLRRRFSLLVSAKGIAQVSAIQLLGELAVLPEDMTDRQWVAHAGLDPRHFKSGTSIDKPSRISKLGNSRIRAALYMPALVAIRFDPNVQAFYQTLLARGKKPLQAIVAVMRKMLCSIRAMFRLDVPFESAKFYHPVDFQESA